MSNISFISYREIIVKILHISVHLLCFQVIETMLELWRWSSICGKEPSTWCEQTIVQRSSNYSQTERLNVSMTFTSNGKLEFVPRDQVPLYLSLLFFISTQKYVVPRNFLSIRIFWAVFICSISILRNSQLQSDVCRLPYTWSLNSLITQSKLKRRQILCLTARLQLPKFIRYSRKANFRQNFRLPASG